MTIYLLYNELFMLYGENSYGDTLLVCCIRSTNVENRNENEAK